VVTQQIASRYGKTYTWEIKATLMGLMGREAAVAIIKALELPIEPEEYMSSSQSLLAQMFTSCEFLPGNCKRLAACNDLSRLQLE